MRDKYKHIRLDRSSKENLFKTADFIDECLFQALEKKQIRPHEKWLRFRDSTPPVSAPQAVTICETAEGRVGYAFCSGKDQFSRKVGRKIALGRAIKT